MASARREQADQSLHERGLADPVAAKDPDDLALLHGDAHVLQNVAGGVAGTQIRGGEQHDVPPSSSTKVDSPHVLVCGDVGDRTLGEDLPLVQDSHGLRDVLYERHVVLNHHGRQPG